MIDDPTRHETIGSIRRSWHVLTYIHMQPISHNHGLLDYTSELCTLCQMQCAKCVSTRSISFELVGLLQPLVEFRTVRPAGGSAIRETHGSQRALGNTT